MLLAILATLALAQEAPTTTQVVVVHQSADDVHREPPMDDRAHVAVGFTFGMSSGFGPSLSIPLGRHHRVSITALPFVVSDAALWSGGLRMQHYLGSNPKTRLYITESVGHHGTSDSSGVLGIGAGAGIETRKRFGTGRVGWFEIDLTAVVTEGHAMLLPLPQAGVAWEF